MVGAFRRRPCVQVLLENDVINRKKSSKVFIEFFMVAVAKPRDFYCARWFFSTTLNFETSWQWKADVALYKPVAQELMIRVEGSTSSWTAQCKQQSNACSSRRAVYLRSFESCKIKTIKFLSYGFLQQTAKQKAWLGSGSTWVQDLSVSPT